MRSSGGLGSTMMSGGQSDNSNSPRDRKSPRLNRSMTRALADDLKKNGGFIPGIKPGKKTAEFLDGIISKITLPGSFFLAIVAILPAFAMIAGISTGFAYFFGGTSLLIMVGVVLDTLQQIESHLLMRHYDGLMKSGKIKGRSSSAFGMTG